MERVLVVGHRNPDTDSVASSISYAYLKNLVDREREYVPVRLGKLNPETEFVLERFGITPPELIEHVFVQIRDVMTEKVVMTRSDSTIYEAGKLMMESGVRNLPVVDENEKLVGLVTERRFARVFLGEISRLSFEDNPPRVSDVVRTLGGKLLTGKPDERMKGRVFIAAMSDETVKERLEEGSVLVVGDREEVIETAVKKRVRFIVVTGGYKPKGGIERFEKNGITVILSPHDTYTTTRLMRLSHPVGNIVKREPLLTSPDTLLKDFEEDLMEDKDGVAVVVDEDFKVVGIVTRHDLINPRRKKVILVDHSEKSQSVLGIEEAEVLEIIDHHRLGGLETWHPITAHIRPVGSTSTIVWELFRSYGVVPPKGIAGLMLSAILSDTMILRSPTTTPEDERAVEHLSSIADVDPVKLGTEMFERKTAAEGMSPRDIITMDMKEYRFPKGSFAVSQIEVIDPKVILSRREEIEKEMEKITSERKYTFMALMVTDVLSETSHVIAVGNRRVIERAFSKKFENGVLRLPKVVSRKKQFVPAISKYL